MFATMHPIQAAIDRSLVPAMFPDFRLVTRSRKTFATIESPVAIVRIIVKVDRRTSRRGVDVRACHLVGARGTLSVNTETQGRGKEKQKHTDRTVSSGSSVFGSRSNLLGYTYIKYSISITWAKLARPRVSRRPNVAWSIVQRL